MKKIKVLDDKTINKIAAGEVVERPISVVKELVENSIDAYSTAITVEIKKGGVSYIRVTDNGLGINREDIKSAFLRHSTSKISKVEDLGNILTLGFRGEALASIAAVSRVELLSKTRIAESGQKIILHGGDIREREEIATTNGTTIIIRDLFFNIPVRKGFLKSDRAEAMAINEFIYKIAISNPNISFTYIKDGKIELKTPGRGIVDETIYSVMGKEFIDSTFKLDYEKDGIKVNGYISNLKYFKGNRSNQFIFVNGRIVKSNLISKAVEEIYKELIPIGKFPNFILSIEIDPIDIDVNMHPSKLEVKFKKERELGEVIKKAISESLYSENLIPEVKIFDYKKGRDKSSEIKNEEVYENIPIFEFIDNNLSEKKDQLIKNTGEKYIENKETGNIKKDKAEKLSKYNNKKLLDEKGIYRKGKEESAKFFVNEKNKNKNSIYEEENIVKLEKKNQYEKKEIDRDREKAIKEEISKNIIFVGVIFDTYILCEDRVNDEFLMIDQHAAHERILYEEFAEMYRKREVYSQEVMSLNPIELSLNDMIKLKNNKNLIRDLGFSFEEFGENTIRVTSVPVVFGNPDTEYLLLDILDTIDVDYNREQNIYDEKIDKVIKQACISAIKGGDTIDKLEAEILIDRLFKSNNPYTCPHGRPITIKTSRKDLEKSFSRIQS